MKDQRKILVVGALGSFTHKLIEAGENVVQVEPQPKEKPVYITENWFGKERSNEKPWNKRNRNKFGGLK